MSSQTPTGFPSSVVDAVLACTPIRPAMPCILGISGLQGSGKSTLARQVVATARSRGLRAATVSLDDFYLTRTQRQLLAHTRHPLLATRGPPGSHDLPLIHAVLEAIRRGQPTRLPRFDKVKDDRHPPCQWEQIDHPLDLLVIEGWMLGATGQPADALLAPVNALEAQEDPAAIWRTWCNQQLADHYPALWQQIDRLCFLQPPDWTVVAHWREQQEATLEQQQGQRGMDAVALQRFIAHFERVSRHALTHLPGIADLRIVLDAQRQVVALHSCAHQG